MQISGFFSLLGVRLYFTTKFTLTIVSLFKKEVEKIDMLILSFFLMIIISTSLLTVPEQPSPRFHVQA